MSDYVRNVYGTVAAPHDIGSASLILSIRRVPDPKLEPPALGTQI